MIRGPGFDERPQDFTAPRQAEGLAQCCQGDGFITKLKMGGRLQHENFEQLPPVVNSPVRGTRIQQVQCLSYVA